MEGTLRPRERSNGGNTQTEGTLKRRDHSNGGTAQAEGPLKRRDRCLEFRSERPSLSLSGPSVWAFPRFERSLHLGVPSARPHGRGILETRSRLITHFPGSSRRRAAATPFFETRNVCRTLLVVWGSRCHSLCGSRAPTLCSAVLHHPLLWLPAAPHRLSCPFFSGPCSLQQSLPT